MRIIGGEFKKKKLASVPGLDTRPTTDRVKESMFNMIYSYSPRMFREDKVVLDIFSGTGALGIEALSRGIGIGIFVDRNPVSIKVIEANIDGCRYNKRARVIRQDVIRKPLEVLPSGIEHVDLIFMDPPYKKGFIEKTVKELKKKKFVSEDTIFVAEHERSLTQVLETDEDCEIVKIKNYGNTSVSIFKY